MLTAGKQNIALPQHRVQVDDAAHVVGEQRQRQQAEEHPRRRVEQSHQLSARVPHARLGPRRQVEVGSQVRRVRHRIARPVRDQDARPDLPGDPQRLFGPRLQPLQQPLQHI
jgi:hypothetical protein